MKNRLTGAGADVDDGAVAIFDGALASNVGRGDLALADDLCVLGLCLFQPRDVFLGNYEDVGRALRIQVFESENVVVFVDFSGRDFAAQQAAKETVSHRFQFWGGVGLSRGLLDFRQRTIASGPSNCQVSKLRIVFFGVLAPCWGLN